MGNAKAQSFPVPGFAPPVNPDVKPDPLAGKHIEDFLCEDFGPTPVTPLQGVMDAPSEPEWERGNDDFIRNMYGEGEVERRKWQDMNEPGGKTFDFRKR